ncbi:hypothetical protein [Kitasatospora sp. NPDC127116]|uniref:hypothetical protein n=1 Tax=Kitasatospora sp. NPDC127116 TaxID=3345367 RepID=UPI00363096F8
MPNGLDEVEQAAEARRRSRTPGGSRNPRTRERGGEHGGASEAAEQREKERQARRQEPVAGAGPVSTGEPAATSEPAPVPEPVPASEPAKSTRPKSIPFYPDADNTDFLWQIAKAAVDRQEKIPATAILRLALRRLQDQMTPERIVRELGGPVVTEGRPGRPRR